VSDVPSAEIWITIAVLAITTAATRAAGPVALGGRTLPPRVTRVIALLAPALLGALVVVLMLGSAEGGELEVDARVLGVGAAAVVLARGGTALPAVAVAAVVTALARALLGA